MKTMLFLTVATVCWLTSVAITRRGSLKLLNDPECGISPIVRAADVVHLHVTNGEEAKDGQFPWLASVQYRRTNRRYAVAEHKCGGTIASPRVVITAAHCLDPIPHYELTSVLVGQVDISSVDQGLEIEVTTKLQHPDYVKGSGRAVNDLGILILAQPLTFGTDIRPA